MTIQASTGYRERRISARDGLSLYLRDYGDPLSSGTPLLCLGGLVRNAQDFELLAGHLASQRRVICPDYRGRGQSAYDPDWRNYKPEVYLADLTQVLAACNLHRVVVCGTSLGGLLAMGLAVMSPTALAGVILNDVGPEIGGPGLERILQYVAHDHPQDDWEAAVAHLKQLFKQLRFENEAKWRRFAEATFKRGADGRLHYNWDTAIGKALTRQSRDKPDLWPLYRALRALPVLAFRGALSDILSQETFDRMAREKPDLIRVTVPDVGHVPVLDEAPALGHIETYLAAVDGAAGSHSGAARHA